jgi:N-dimethylarginine dimethylaminohydrolase
MITTDPHAYAAAVTALPATGAPTMRAALLVDPSGLRVSEQSATDNRYMVVGTPIDRERARRQWDDVAATLRACGVPVLAFPGVEGQDDGVYPNNVFATIPGRLVVGAMKHPVRRKEAERADIRGCLSAFGYAVHDLSGLDGVAELTGVLAVDRARRTAVCGRSPRVDEAGVAAMHRALDLRTTLVTPLVEGEYHLNLVLAVLAGRAAVCWDEGFVDSGVPRALATVWPGAVLHLSTAEKAAFAGNCIAVTPDAVMLSVTAWDALCPAAKAWFPRHGFAVHPVAVDELEKGGGSLRCLIAELF